jgi:hypothetical protein
MTAPDPQYRLLPDSQVMDLLADVVRLNTFMPSVSLLESDGIVLHQIARLLERSGRGVVDWV